MCVRFLWFFIFLNSYVFCENNYTIYKFCVNELRTSGRICQAVQKGNSQVICVLVTDSADCALRIQRKEVDFAIFSAEEALLVSKFIDDDVRIVGELRSRDWINETFAFQTVVVVRENYNGGFNALQNTNYCHPGFGQGQFWSDRVLKEFEKTVVPRECVRDLSTTEHELNLIANFFKSACRPGQWTLDDSLDKKLKKKYQNLCALCDSPVRCSYRDESQGTHEEALSCLTENGGDVTYVALQYVKEYFGLIPGYKARASATEYKFLCPNGRTQKLTESCAWVKQPWPVIVALKNKAPLLTTLLPSFLCKDSHCRGTWQEAFTILLEGTSESYLPNAFGERTLLDNLKQGRNIPREGEGDSCRKSVRLCAASRDEYEKCEWLKEAVVAQDIEPRVTCVRGNNSIWSCFDLIRKHYADVVGIDANYAFMAKKIFNLSTIMYADNTYEGNYMILAVIRADNKEIRSVGDLRGKRACFPEYGGLAWNSFLTVAKKHSILPQLCPDIKAVGTFFSKMCAPGAMDGNHKDYGASAPDNVCSLCAKKFNNSTNSTEQCASNSNNQYYGDYGAFSCLSGNSSSVVADVAFVDYRRLSKKNAELMKKVDKNAYRILCRNSTVRLLQDYSQISEDCMWSFGVGSEIVGRDSNKRTEKQDVIEMLLKMDDRFGEIISGFDTSIHMYGIFNGSSGLLFEESTIDLVSVHDQNNYYVNSFVDLKTAAFEQCHEKAKSVAHHFTLSAWFILVTSLIPFC